jgi:hypothetical protein
VLLIVTYIGQAPGKTPGQARKLFTVDWRHPKVTVRPALLGPFSLNAAAIAP